MSALRRGKVVGYGFLLEHLRLTLPPLRTIAVLGTVTAMTAVEGGLLVPAHVAPKNDSILDHVLFALKHEGVELAVLKKALPYLDVGEFVAALHASPNSGYLRIVGYLFEALTGSMIDDMPAIGGAYVDLFDPQQYYTGETIRSTRWKVNFNGIGSIRYCPVVRRDQAIEALIDKDILGQVVAFFADKDQEVLDRALAWAYLSETERSFALEREVPQQSKKEVFVRLLQMAHEPRAMTEDYLVELQNSTISNPLDQASQFRTEQNWLRKRGVRGPAGVSYVPPTPDDAARLMEDLLSLLNSKPATIDPIMLGAVISFGFVFIHPFMDGNGRLGRFLMHYTLCQSGKLPEGAMLPISVAMKRNELDYLKALQDFSRPSRAFWQVSMRDEDHFQCAPLADDTMYRYWDATDCVKFIYRMALNALERDLAAETRFLLAFDEAYRMIDEQHDVRDHDLNNMIMWCAANDGILSKKRRQQLAHLYQADVFDAVEEAVREAFAGIDTGDA